MTGPAELFRAEALEYRSRPRGSGTEVRLGAPWVRWLYWALLVLVVAGVSLGALVHVERTTSGPARVDLQARTFVAVLPAVAEPELRNGRPVRLELDGPTGQLDVAASVLQVQAADDVDVRRAGLGSFPQPAVLVTGRLAGDAGIPAGSPSVHTGRAVVGLGSQRALPLLLDGFDEGEQG